MNFHPGHSINRRNFCRLFSPIIFKPKTIGCFSGVRSYSYLSSDGCFLQTALNDGRHPKCPLLFESLPKNTATSYSTITHHSVQLQGLLLGTLMETTPKPVGQESEGSHSWIVYKTTVASSQVERWMRRQQRMEQQKSRTMSCILISHFAPSLLIFNYCIYYHNALEAGCVWKASLPLKPAALRKLWYYYLPTKRSGQCT